MYGYNGYGYSNEYNACSTTGYSYGYKNNTFGTILVLFILLVIIGCTCYNSGYKA